MTSECGPGKGEWPELVGANGAAAEATVERENPNVNAIVVPEGNAVILDLRCNRVWVWVDPNTRRVTRIPRIG